MAGDFSPLAVDATQAGSRFAPPALLVAAAIGLGSMDMPVPSIAEWEWVNWHFPRPVKAGETIYARWTLTQKRPPVGGAPTAIVVWRVDVHTADGALCAEGEVGASVRRKAQAARPGTADAAAPPGPAPRRRRGRRSPAKAVEAPPPPPPVEAAPKAVPAEKAGTPRRRRRRRSRAGSGPASNGPMPAGNAAAEPPPTPQPAAVASTAQAAPSGALSRVMKRLRRT